MGGIHGHFINLDDPLNPTDSLSDVMVKNSNEWLDNVIYSRKVDKC